MRTWHYSEIHSSAVPPGDRYIATGGELYECYERDDMRKWRILATRPSQYPLDEWDIALLRHSFGLSEDVKL